MKRLVNTQLANGQATSVSLKRKYLNGVCCCYSLVLLVLVLFVNLYVYFVLVVSPTLRDVTSDVDLSIRWLDPHNYSYIINRENLCNGDQILLLVGVCSSVQHLRMRDAIRDTWGQVAKNRPDVRLAFMLGRTKNESLQKEIDAESRLHGDVIQEDFVDTYFNLSIKSVMLLKWIDQYCSQAEYVLKTDDDMFINLPNLLKYLNATRDRRWQLFGHLNYGTKPNRSRSSKRFSLVANYKYRLFPRYLAGGAYAMSGDVAHALYQECLRTPVFRVEDVYITGLLANRINVPRFDHGSFKVNKNTDACSYKNAISGHGFQADELRRTWERLWRDCP